MKKLLVAAAMIVAGALAAGCPPKKTASTKPECVSACIQRNQMRAVSPEQIEADCVRECEESK